MENSLICFLFAIDIACACGFIIIGITFAKARRTKAFNKCRFCKKRNIKFEYALDNNFKELVQVYCENCDNTTGKYFTKEDAFNAWNEENK